MLVILIAIYAIPVYPMEPIQDSIQDMDDTNHLNIRSKTRTSIDVSAVAAEKIDDLKETVDQDQLKVV